MDILNDVFTRPVIAHTHLPGVLHFLSMKGKEGLSQLYSFEVELVAKTYMLDCRDALGKSMTLQVETEGGIPRFMHGVITKFELIGREMVNSQYYIYKATLSPLLWYATLNKEYQIFQNMTVPEIIQKVLGEYGMEIEMDFRHMRYRNWEYCVQYDETDFDFVSRLMEHEGMYYWFKMLKGKHTLVITDRNTTHKDYAGYEVFTFLDKNEHVRGVEEFVSEWQVATEIASGTYSTDDYDFRKSRASINAFDSLGTEATVGNNEIYEWMGGYVEPEDGEYYSLVRHEELRVERDIISGETNIRAVKPGRTFTLRNHPRHKENKKYLLISAEYDMQVAGYSTGTDREDHFAIKFKALPIETQFRKKRETPKPKTYGPQTAKVVGPAGQEIWTDKFARVKVQFHWDRYGTNDENSSCWIRVSSPWAGTGFGGLQIPRIEDEVVVDFIGGNPDRPIIIGRVYNDMHMPMVDLPAKAHTSGFRSKSIYGDTHQENHFLMIDELGKELVDLRAQYDMLVEVINNLTVKVGNNVSTTIGGDETRVVGRTRTTTIKGHELEKFKDGVTSLITSAGLYNEIVGGVERHVKDGNIYTLEGNNIETINKGSETYKITDGGRTVEIKGTETYKITSGGRDTNIKSAVKDTFQDTWTQDIKGKVDQTYKSGKDEKVTSGGVTETYTGNHKKDVDGEVLHTSTGKWHTSTNGDSTYIKMEGANIEIFSDAKIHLKSNDVKIEDNTHWSKGFYKLDTYIYVGIARGVETKGVGIEKKLAGSVSTYYGKKLDIGFHKTDVKMIEVKNTGKQIQWGGMKTIGKIMILVL
ncbi:MAG: type VI secretion system tip protein TssI/VgrG [Pelistega sp.]|nr:type VI secretion system tip protein TssI/VgrG [Pelistega sp.]